MTDVQKMIGDIESTDQFKKWVGAHPEHYLVHLFCIVKENIVQTELGYYSKNVDKITVFESESGVMRPPEEVFKEGGELTKLDVDKVKTGLEEARAIAERYRSEKYPDHPLQQQIIILQQAEQPVWNITLVLMTLNMLNLKISAETGEILHEEMRNILDLRANTGKD